MISLFLDTNNFVIASNSKFTITTYLLKFTKLNKKQTKKLLIT